jgi:hypothetical protein
MGLYVLKSVSARPLRFNVSGRGAGVSVGTSCLRVLALVAVLAPLARAKTALGKVPPSVLERFGRSLVFIGVMGVLIGGLLALCIGGAVGQRASRFRNWTFGLVVLACVLAGAALATTDAMNDGARNPAMYGAFGLTPLLAAAVLLLQPRRTAGGWIFSLLLTPPFCVGVLFLLTFIQEAGFNLAW